MSRPRLAVASDVATVVLAIAALGVLGFRLFPRDPEPTGPVRELSGAEVSAILGSRAVMGAAVPKVSLAVFSDYQCPYCKVADERLTRILGDHPSELAIVVRHLPLEQIHPVARMAASAADCATEQGQLTVMHRALFAHQGGLAAADRRWFEHLADSLGLPDHVRFSTCLGSEESFRRIAADVELATRLGVTGTPALLVGRTLILGAPDEAGLANAVQRMLDDAR